MKLRLTFALGFLAGFNLFAALPTEYESLKADAEKLIAEASFAKAHDVYASITLTNLPAAEQRWVEFRLADTQWRSQAATQTADTTKLDQARQQLEVLIRDITREEDHDRVWVEVQESLGDFFWTRREVKDWGQAWQHYQPALEWWAGAPEIELARTRYLAIVWRIARPPQVQPYYYYGMWGNVLPLDVIENTLKIARTDNDRAHAHYLLAMTLRQQAGDPEQGARVPEEFEGALKIGKTTDWYDDALYNYAEWMMSQSRLVTLPDGNQTYRAEYARALELFRRLVSEFSKGETRYWEQAQQQIKGITDPQVSVSVSSIFLPDSEIQYYLGWRNVKQIELTLYAVELNRDVKLTVQQSWLQSINPGSLEKIKSWTHDPRPKVGQASRLPGERDSASGRTSPSSSSPTGAGETPALPSDDYTPGNETLRLDAKLKPGAYLIEARGGGVSGRDLILVTDAALVLKSSGRQALVYFCNALDSSPLTNGAVKLQETWWENNSWHSREQSKVTGADGVAVFELEHHPNTSSELFASAIRGDRQAFSPGNGYWYNRDTEAWKIYAFTDRPAYRPKETVNWKFLARRYNGSVYSTPSDQVVEFDITDPRGAKVKSDKVTLNAFGSATGTLELTTEMPLGEYRVTFRGESPLRDIGYATLFRLEEYKLPEYKVSVTTPEENGRKKIFKLGDKVEVEVQADYYFGGPVANASVELLVYQNPYWQSWHRPREFAWYYDDMDNNYSRYGRWYGGGGQVIKRETLKTDATGKAKLTFDTPRGSGQDFEYRIEARVTDSSRREITGNGTVRVTRQRFYVNAEAAHNLYRPQDKVEVEFHALDANDQPVQTEGTVKVARDYWYEIWIAPDGREVKDDELKTLRGRSAIWPPAPSRPNEPGWRLKLRGYQHDDILTKTLKTDTNGAAQFDFRPEREGYYHVSWTSEDAVARLKSQVSNPIRADAPVWVANNATTELGYRHGGMEIIVDKDTFRVGAEAPVMLVVPASDRYVLFTVEGQDLYHYQVVHVTGTVKLIQLPIVETHVPNIFLSASLVNDRQIFTDTKQIIVPPTKNFLTVDVKPDHAQYQPRDEGTLVITTKNDEGKPVSAEVSLGLVDESVFYIQSDYAGDPRQFYYGTKRGQEIRTQATMNQKSYAKLVEGENEQLIDDREFERQKISRERRQSGYEEYDKDAMEFTLSDSVDRLDLAKSESNLEAVTASGGVGGGGGGGLAFNRSVGALSRRAFGGRLGAQTATPPASAAYDPYFAAKEPAGAEEPAVVVRSDFRSTVFWQPDLKTDAKGQATVKVKYPDSLTGWKATARAAGTGNQFGIADATTRTKQPFIVRLQAPRFFVVGDTVTLSAVVNNNTDQAMEVRVALEVVGGLKVGQASRLSGAGETPALLLSVPANAEARADWTAEVKTPGEVKLKVTGRGGKYSDAMEKTYLTYEHGIEKFIAKSGKARGNEITVKLDLPRERKADSTSLTVQVTPSMAVTMLDALPYLIDYPYGCTEQTMSRFLPAAITAKTLRDLGLQPEDVMGRVFGGIETNSAAATHPKGKRDLAELDAITKASLERLYDFQHGDGGWGWWKQGESDHWMTAYVVWGLSLARDAGLNIKLDVLQRGVAYLDKTLVEEELNPDMQAFMLHALTAYNVSQKETKLTKFQETAFNNLWNNREKLNAYTRALLALSAHAAGKTSEAKTLIENLENGVKRDERPDASVLISPDTSHPAPDTSVQGTAHWGEDGIYWRWSDGGIEATAFALRALLAIDPTNKLVEPVSNWLIKNRRGAQWNSTRDTAIVVLAMNDYLRTSGELKGDIGYDVYVNGAAVAHKDISGADVFNAPSRFAIDRKLIKDANEIRIVRKSGDQPLYFAAEAKFFSLEEPIAPAGSEIFVKREYFKLVGRPTLLKGLVYDKLPLADGETVKSGERVETLLTIEAKNNYEYLMFEDLKPSGLEAVEVRSGESLYARELKSGAVDQKFSRATGTNTAAMAQSPIGNPQSAIRNPQSAIDYTGRQRWVYQELRDRKVALFLDKLPEGVWEIRYDLRAEVPGQFHALPVVGQAMYVPEIRCNGAEIRIKVEDSKETGASSP